MSENEQANSANLRTVYQELCTSYHGIADFRAKLLGLLPLASGAGIFLLLEKLPNLEQPPTILLAVGVFGFLMTLGLFTYELRGIQRCNGLIEAGKVLERELGFQGQFRLRPGAINGLIGTTLAARIIYPGVLAAWSFVILYGIIPIWGEMIVGAIVFIGGIAGSFRLQLKPNWEEMQKQA
jgi:hypothetical protein